MSKDEKCDCAATGPDECACGAWDNDQRSTEQIRRAVDAECTCGGGEPADCCPACKVWHGLYPPKTIIDQKKQSDCEVALSGSVVLSDKIFVFCEKAYTAMLLDWWYLMVRNALEKRNGKWDR